MSILIHKSGILSTIQDLGRNGFRRYGINPNGTMDKAAARLINILLGNDENAAVLEMHFPAPVLEFEEPAIFALGGADFGAKLDDKLIENWRPVLTEKNQTLRFTKKTFGNRIYLSISGGFQIEKWLASASTNLMAKIGGFEGRELIKGDKLFYKPKTANEKRKADFKITGSVIPHYSRLPTARVVAGAEFNKLTAIGERNFLKQDFAISRNSNRMGFRLNGEPLYLQAKIEMVSSAVAFGTIQLLPDGQMIILMADHQTSGGYPRIAHVVSVDLPILAQLGANDKVNFELISIEEAENLTLKFEKDLSWLKAGIRLGKLWE
ncbi:MAG: biotin-dependent carboxyltransferase family protein [Pyrinomonadaceae bacterium]|nr:biotin-dependent carboxyltransferase family protein [Pyrinomonadaceae bacterium]